MAKMRSTAASEKRSGPGNAGINPQPHQSHPHPQQPATHPHSRNSFNSSTQHAIHSLPRSAAPVPAPGPAAVPGPNHPQGPGPGPGPGDPDVSHSVPLRFLAVTARSLVRPLKLFWLLCPTVPCPHMSSINATLVLVRVLVISLLTPVILVGRPLSLRRILSPALPSGPLQLQKCQTTPALALGPVLGPPSAPSNPPASPRQA